MAGRFRRRKRHVDEMSQELELMPMLNVFISIIPLLLLSAAFVQVAIIPAAVTADAAAPPAAGEAPFDLAVVVSADAFVVQANGLDVGRVARTGDRKTVDRQLQASLEQVAAGHPDHKEVRILAGSSAHYLEIIEVMDASRAAGFPNAALDGDESGA